MFEDCASDELVIQALCRIKSDYRMG